MSYYQQSPRRIKLATSPKSWAGYDHLVIIGQHQAVSNAVQRSSLELDLALSTIKEPKRGGLASVLFEVEETVLKVSLVVVTSKSSRMNHPERPDAFSKHLSSLVKSTDQTAILVCPSHEDHYDALIIATSRAFPRYSRKSDDRKKRSLIDVSIDGVTDESTLERLDILAEGVSHAAEWVDAPPAEFHVSEFIEVAREIAVRHHVEIDVFEGKQLMEMGAGGLWGVGMAAKYPPALVVLRGPKSTPDAPNMVWVGKGIVYDTGGLSLKPKGSMGGMKMDMGGAAGVLAAFEVAVARGLAQDLCAVLCLAENAIGPEALRNDDIITLYSGKTVEINNTDAEGRLVLGDGVAYAAQHLSPVVIVDMATLTGAQLVATGRHFAAVVSNDAELEESAIEAGSFSGDLVHPLPYCPELLSPEFNSKVADMKNSVKDRMNAQSSCAGHFVESHLVDYTGKWLHVDIAGPAFIQERGTGFGVGLLSTLAAAWQRGELEG